MARTDNLTNYLEDVATAIKNKKGDDTPIKASEFDTEIENLPSGGSSKYNTTIDTDIELYSYIGIKGLITEFDPSITIHCNSIIGSSFSYCENLKVAPKLETSNTTNLTSLFNGCKKLTTVSAFDCSKVVRVSKPFEGCINLTNFGGFIDLGKAYYENTNNNSDYQVNVSDCTKLTHESLMNIINNLYDLNLSYNVAGGGKLYQQVLILGDTNLAKLSQEEIAIATNKGWIVY